MPISTNFNVNPYYDDFDDEKKFLRLLYKPGYAVQARELTQAQTILQKQIERFGNHIFKSGSVVTGGQVFIQDVTYMNLEPQYATLDIVAADFEDKIILSNDDVKRGQILKVIDATANTPHTILVKQIYGSNFISGDSIKTVEAGGDAFANRANVSTSGVGTGQIFSVNEGVYYYEGYFVKVDAQTIATSVYDNTSANVKIGFEVTESIVESVDDTTLLDPAQGASNFQAPGSDRFKIELKLAVRSLDSTDLTKFIELAQIKEGIPQRISRTPIYSELEETFARRTYDESGDYVVDPFLITTKTNTSNSANLDITMSQGKAYVKGYEFTSIAPVTITIPKPRDTVNVSLKRITADYGNFLYTTNHYGHVPAQSVGTVDLHCVSNNSIWTANTAVYNNTKIGTAKVTRFAFDSTGGNQSDANTYVYRTFLTDINVGSIVATVNCSINTTAFGLSNSQLGQTSNIDQAYTGAKIRILSGPGAGEYPRTITSYSGVTKNVTVSPAFSVAPTSSSIFSIDFELKDAESLTELIGDGSLNFSSAANIHPFSKDLSSVYQNVFATEKDNEPLLIKLGEDYIVQNSLSSFSYEYQKFLPGVTISTSGGISSVDLAPYLSAGETLATSTNPSTTTKQENFLVKVNTTNSSYVKNQIVAGANLNLSGTTLSFTVGTYTGTANIFATVISTASSKNKQYVNANCIVQSTDSAYSIFANNAVYVWPDKGQTQIHATSYINKIPSVPQSLFVSDVVSVNAIFDFQGSAISEAGLSSAANVTSRFDLSTGQKDTYYDHSYIVLRQGETAPTGPLLIRYNRYKQETTTPGYYTVDSYLRGHNNTVPENPVTYETIPVYESPSSKRAPNGVYVLRDYLDFRPIRLDASGTDRQTLANNRVFGNPLVIPQNGQDITASFKNYLPRIDKVAITKSRTFEIIRGPSANKPVMPQDKQDAMTIYILSYPPFVEEPRNIKITPVKNQRYTMKDIGVMEKRLENLEYYTSLSLLEFDTSTKQDFTILDSANLPRFKNGFIVDAFNGTSVSDVLNYDYKASIDRFEKHLRPTYNLSSIGLEWSTNDGDNTNINRKGSIFTVDSTEVSYLTQGLASKSVNVNPFNIVNFLGVVRIDPETDTWFDTDAQPDLVVDISGDRDAWNQLASGAANTEWGAWETQWTGKVIGEEVVSSNDWKEKAGGRSSKQLLRCSGAGESFPEFDITTPPSGWRVGTSPQGYGITNYYLTNGTKTIACSFRGANYKTMERNTTLAKTLSEGQARTGTKSTVEFSSLTRKLGDRVLDVSIVPYMRQKNILYLADSFKPSTQLYAFFDNDNISPYCSRANKIYFKQNNLGYKTTKGDTENISIKNNITNTVNATAKIVMTSGYVGYIVSTSLTSSLETPQTGATLSVVGQTTSTNVVVDYYEHFTGQVYSNPTSTTTVVLGLMAAGAQNCTSENLVGQPFSIVNGAGAGQERTITAYDSATRTVTLNAAWAVNPNVDSVYTIGRPTTDSNGATAGIFFMPASTFRVGQKLFRLIDDSAGNIQSSTTNGESRFFSQGLLSKVQSTSIIATTATGIKREGADDTREIISTDFVTRTDSEKIEYKDPIAQTFLVGSSQYPNGMFINKIRVCFKTKDPTVPVTLEVRPTVNGYPSSSVVYPLGAVTLTPDKVKISTVPSLTDANKYTDFIFDSPIFVQPGEHCFVLLANSKLYEVFVGEIGKTNLLDNTQISEQPYMGSMFLSQNGSTWTAEQNLDIMFEIYRNQYSTTPSQIVFKPNMDNISANIVFDVAHLMSTDLVLPGTNITYMFNSELNPYGGMSGYLPIVPNNDYETVIDEFGRRVINPSSGNNTFKVIATLSTTDSALSPYIDSTRMNLLAIENRINNLPLSNSLITIANSGTPGLAMTDGIYLLDLSNTSGSGAIVYANVVSGLINRTWVSNGGSGYKETPTVNLYNSIAISAGGYTGGMIVDQALANSKNTSIVITGETSAAGGPAEGRYIMRTVTLADGFDSGDLRVYLTAYKPVNANIDVYYKILSISDPTPFAQRQWQLMTQIDNFNFTSESFGDFRELVFAPGVNGVANNNVLYAANGTAFTSFKTFAIKIVMSGTDTTNVPLLKDLRVIALPEGS